MAIDVREHLPRDKFDIANAEALIALGHPAVSPVLPDLLEWLQDCNWPVSKPIGDFLTTLPNEMAPLIWTVLRGNDHVWKYWCIFRLISTMPADTAEQFRSELARLAEDPTETERQEELHEVAKDALNVLWPSDGG
ncbi:DUF5071 domain-containing protein [Adhaeretor mobilis]|uniref:DUF5071 domain-containing protein n=1 Tax=Adhaeretor mobilis TaxID=1930276 RepID=A0A517N2G4_9BACT|nr:DUF5071 domain-containing protein [Adhaeretor mobilis]QDT01340.1 hypothetical protein HG15A2_46820 [Adhaeretor mobilis]